MDTRPTIGILALVVMLLTASLGCVPPAIYEDDYRLVFEDHFATFDTSVWGTHHPWSKPPPASAIIVSDGVLRLRSTRANGYHRPHVTTLGPRSESAYPHYPDATTFQEGYIEARLRYTDSAHSRPIFWLLGAEWAQRWPESACPTLQGEVDIFEPLMLPTDEFHFAQHRNTSSPCGVPQTGRGIKRQMDFNLSGWHTYAVKWAEGELCSYVDDVEIGCLQAFDAVEQPMYIILSQDGQCSPWRGGLCAEPKPAAIVTEVDWIRVWQLPE